MTLSALIYDCEIKKCIPPRDGKLQLGLEYCQGWDDFAGMGVAVVGVWDCLENLPRVFGESSLDQLQALARQRLCCVGFNSHKFDRTLLAANGVEIAAHQSYDILRELWIASGLDPDAYDYKTHGGYSLNDCAITNFGMRKSGTGELAPVLWQQRRHMDVVDYCLRDVMLTRRLFLRAMQNDGAIKHPRTGEIVKIRVPKI